MSKEIDQNWSAANSYKEVDCSIDNELGDVQKDFEVKKIVEKDKPLIKLRLVDSIKQGIYESMEEHDNLVIMGQDIAEYGGVFKVTDGLFKKYGKNRVLNTPLCESVILSSAYGLSVGGYKSIVEMQFADFVSSGFTAVVNLIAKSNYRWSQESDIVIRVTCGSGVEDGQFQSKQQEEQVKKDEGVKGD